jgi:membrane-associated HD superfamily phosphohydrolase
LEDWKIKIAMLWLVYECGSIVTFIFDAWTPGWIERTTAGEMMGLKLTPEMLLVFSIMYVVPQLMAFATLTLKDSINRWVNMILSMVFAVIATIGMIPFFERSAAYSLPILLSQVVANVLIVWYAWKSKQKA